MAAASGSDLSALVSTERRLEERLARAAEEARGLVEGARRAAAEAAAALEAELERSLAGLGSEAARERERRLLAIAEEGRRAEARFDGVSDEEVAVLAGVVLAALVPAVGRGAAGGGAP